MNLNVSCFAQMYHPKFPFVEKTEYMINKRKTTINSTNTNISQLNIHSINRFDLMFKYI